MDANMVERAGRPTNPGSGGLPVGTVLGEYWRRAVLFMVAMLALGAVAGYFTPLTFVAHAEVIAGATSVNAAAVPSFTQAGQALAETYSRVFAGDGVQSAMKSKLGGSVSATASPIPGSSVILIESTADTAAKAVDGANVGADALVTVVAGLLDNTKSIASVSEKLNQAYSSLAASQAVVRVAQLRIGTAPPDRSLLNAQAKVQSDQATVNAYVSALNSSVTDGSQSNGVQKLSSGEVSSSNMVTRYMLTAGVGLVVGLGAIVLLAYVRAYRLALGNHWRSGDEVGRTGLHEDRPGARAHAAVPDPAVPELRHARPRSEETMRMQRYDPEAPRR